MEAAAPLIAQATNDATAYMAAQARMWEASAACAKAGWLRKRTATHAATEAAVGYRTTRDTVLRRWGGVPQSQAVMQPWADAVARAHADVAPRVVEARERAEQFRTEHAQLTDRHRRERAELTQNIFGGHYSPVRRSRSAEASVAQWHQRADLTLAYELRSLVGARHELAEIGRLPTERSLAARGTQLAVQDRKLLHSPERPGPERLPI